MKKNEENTILWINNMRVIMDILLGPFLTAYFIKTSKTNIAIIFEALNLSIKDNELKRKILNDYFDFSITKSYVNMGFNLQQKS